MLSAGFLEDQDVAAQVFGSFYDIGAGIRRRTGSGISSRIGDIVVARMDHIECLAVRNATMSRQVVRNLVVGRDRCAKASGCCAVDRDVLRAAGGVIRAPRSIRRIGGEAEVPGEILGVHQSRRARRRAGAICHGGRPKAVEGRAAAGAAEQLIVAGIDVAVAEHDDLAVWLRRRGSCARQHRCGEQNSEQKPHDHLLKTRRDVASRCNHRNSSTALYAMGAPVMGSMTET